MVDVLTTLYTHNVERSTCRKIESPYNFEAFHINFKHEWAHRINFFLASHPN